MKNYRIATNIEIEKGQHCKGCAYSSFENDQHWCNNETYTPAVGANTLCDNFMPEDNLLYKDMF